MSVIVETRQVALLEPDALAEDHALARQVARKALNTSAMAQAAAHAAETEQDLQRLADLCVVADEAVTATVDYATVAGRLARGTTIEQDAAAAMRIARTARQMARAWLETRAGAESSKLLAAAHDARVA